MFCSRTAATTSPPGSCRPARADDRFRTRPSASGRRGLRSGPATLTGVRLGGRGVGDPDWSPPSRPAGSCRRVGLPTSALSRARADDRAAGRRAAANINPEIDAGEGGRPSRNGTPSRLAGGQWSVRTSARTNGTYVGDPGTFPDDQSARPATARCSPTTERIYLGPGRRRRPQGHDAAKARVMTSRPDRIRADPPRTAGKGKHGTAPTAATTSRPGRDHRPTMRTGQ